MADDDSTKSAVADPPVVSLDDLLPGDVLLYRPAGPNAVQRRISATTSSPYTHAAIHLGGGEIAESVA
ncbi:hypothetical protein K9U39_18025 [Rhodoblastus acidophilus]|uniref:Uncharacterized protein n=1 Tax=Candidatus Rhodoblastus alkanivorans TaxID=2954117 RepID=A0ABS9Z286_9HYPH|nr:hypothetical protein [Candidatus Rhodoblastus alkanivorans]MCI4680593.1 hypothetical protein [Candidatus Rhodoblastus alkanivorans]MCI4681761.1 hypothetical protein [Candidatus Rhodoblastus alkanivorans]MDI4642810.1 hypothetical protein [Rhodoblastus acidophilus]